MSYGAIIVDFDWTLLHTDKTLSEYTRRVMRECQATGSRLFAATARPERSIAVYREMIPFDAVTTLNGARTITQEAVFENPISRDSASSVLEQLCAVPGLEISVETDYGFFANVEIPMWNPTVTDRIPELPLKGKVYKILASHPEIPVDRISLNLPDDTYCSVGVRRLVQVMSKTATKWNGVQKMLEAYGISAEQAIYFGDDNDDLEPIRRCGCGVAVSNALDCIRDAADYITDSNDEDGVARFLATGRG